MCSNDWQISNKSSAMTNYCSLSSWPIIGFPLQCNTITIIAITLDWWQIASSSHARVSQCLVSCNKDACTQRKPAFVEPRARIIIIFTVIIKVVDPCTHAWSSFSLLSSHLLSLALMHDHHFQRCHHFCWPHTLVSSTSSSQVIVTSIFSY